MCPTIPFVGVYLLLGDDEERKARGVEKLRRGRAAESFDASATSPQTVVSALNSFDLFGEGPFTPTVVQWHEDAIVDLPPGAVLLASSSKYPNQAFRVGDRAWGLQFHIETPPEMVRHWGAEYGAAVVEAGLDPGALAERTVAELPEVEACWRPVVERFAGLAQGRGRVVLPLLEG